MVEGKDTLIRASERSKSNKERIDKLDETVEVVRGSVATVQADLSSFKVDIVREVHDSMDTLAKQHNQWMSDITGAISKVSEAAVQTRESAASAHHRCDENRENLEDHVEKTDSKFEKLSSQVMKLMLKMATLLGLLYGAGFAVDKLFFSN